MKNAFLFAMVLSSWLGYTVYAQDIAGDWQGTVKLGTGAANRVVLHVTGHGGGDLTGMIFLPDRPSAPDGFGVNSFALRGSDVRFSVDALHIAYDGKISADGTTIAGLWTQGKPQPVDFHRATKATSWRNVASQRIEFITVDKNVRLEVVDWGGTGRPLVLLAGLGNTAHIFDRFAPKLAADYHVFAITRRGFGESSTPCPTPENYSADRLADDVLAIIDALRLERPFVAGHSIAGEELSSLGSRHPERVSGLIYLDADFSQSLYDRSRGDLQIDANDVQQRLDQLAVPGGPPPARKYLIQELLQSSLPQLEKDLQEQMNGLKATPDLPASAIAAWGPPTPWSPAAQAIIQGQQKYTEIRCPVLAVVAVPHQLGPGASAEARASDLAETGQRAKLFESGIPGAKVVRLANAGHYIFVSNEGDVVRAMDAFTANIP